MANEKLAALLPLVQNGVAKYRIYADAEPLVAMLVGLEGYEQEVQTRIDVLGKEEAALIVSCNSLRKIADDEMTLTEAMRKAADDYAATVKQTADADVQSKLQAAEEALHAHADAAKLRQGILDAELRTTRDEVEAAHTEFDALTAKIADAKAQITKLLG